MRIDMFKNVYRIRIVGLNLDRLINFIRNNYKAYNIVRINYDEMIVDLSYNSYSNLLLKMDSSCYNITIERVFGYKRFIDIVMKNLAFTVSLIIAIGVALFFGTRLLRVNIYGAEESTRLEILNLLDDKNISIMSSNNISIDNLEQSILESVDSVSLVSAVIKGNVLVINVKEKLPEPSDNFVDIVAPYNLVIDSIECHQGTLLKHAGDLVKKGEVIIGAYIISDTENTPVEPIYELSATTYVSSTIEFKSTDTKLIRTGRKITNSCYNMFGIDFLGSNMECEYTSFEEEYVEQKLFDNLFIPVTIKKHIYYELEEMTYTYDFENEKERLLLEGVEKARVNVPMGMSIINTTQEIVDNGETKLIQTYLEVEVRLTND